MPHIWIEYSANIEAELGLDGLMQTVQDAAVGDGSVFPLAGARTRAVPVQRYRIADGHPDNAFVHVVLKVGHGRPLAEREACAKRTFAALQQALAAIMASRPLGLSLQLDEADPVLNYKDSNYREHLAARRASSGA